MTPDNFSPASTDEAFALLVNAIKSGLNGAKVMLDGKEVGKLVTDHQAAEASKPVASASGFDPRLSLPYPW